MSRNERERMTIMTGVKKQALTLAAAAGLMGVCYRLSKRIWRRYQADGDAGLVHQLRCSARRTSFVERFTTCGKANCLCVTGQKHGPFYYLTANLDVGQIRKTLLKTTAQR
jgi:Family of unknown function (DUF6788)